MVVTQETFYWFMSTVAQVFAALVVFSFAVFGFIWTLMQHRKELDRNHLRKYDNKHYIKRMLTATGIDSIGDIIDGPEEYINDIHKFIEDRKQAHAYNIIHIKSFLEYIMQVVKLDEKIGKYFNSWGDIIAIIRSLMDILDCIRNIEYASNEDVNYVIRNIDKPKGAFKKVQSKFKINYNIPDSIVMNDIKSDIAFGGAYINIIKIDSLYKNLNIWLIRAKKAIPWCLLSSMVTVAYSLLFSIFSGATTNYFAFSFIALWLSFLSLALFAPLGWATYKMIAGKPRTDDKQ